MTVQELISGRQETFSIGENATVFDAARYLRDKQTRAAGVLDAAGRLVGVISQSDISDKVSAENKCPAWMRVSEIMTRELVHDFSRSRSRRVSQAHGKVRHLPLAGPGLQR